VKTYTYYLQILFNLRFFRKQMKNNGIIVESEVVRRLTFKAEYDMSCDLLNGCISRAVLRSTLTHRRDQIQKFCAGSKYDVNQLMLLFCDLYR